jgi:hypothetical protein
VVETPPAGIKTFANVLLPSPQPAPGLVQLKRVQRYFPWC